MTGPWQIAVYDNQQLVYSGKFSGPVELGRQTEQETAPDLQGAEPGQARLIIARSHEQTVSRKHLLLEPLPDGRVRVRNLSRKVPVLLSTGRLEPAASRDEPLPISLQVGPKSIRVHRMESQDAGLKSLAIPVRPPGSGTVPATRLPSLAASTRAESNEQEFIRWLEAALEVLQSAASSEDFFQKAARATVEMVGLDSGRALLFDQDRWGTVALYNAPHISDELSWQPSRRVLETLRRERRTSWQNPSGATSSAASLTEIDAVVAAPILNRDGRLIGALYGDRRQAFDSEATAPITELEAMLIELLATGVAAGLSRLEQEQAALAARVRFEQFFTPELSRQLASQPDMLKGRDSEITLLFCDIRGFSRISERLGPAGSVEWLGDVMGVLSDCVLRHAGVLVDYVGDELMAMWGAPEEQPEHARLACRAALDMLRIVPELNRRWEVTLQEPLGLGIGLNTGIARVGNTGSHHKFKYGPLGSTVNLASRVEGATKYLGTSVLITGETYAGLGVEFNARRVCRVRVVNIAEPVELYELMPPDAPDWQNLKDQYEQALSAFERGDFRRAAQVTGNLLAAHPHDGPGLVLLSRSATALLENSDGFDAVWRLPGK